MQNNDVFIQFDNFIVNKKDIIYAKQDAEKNTITMVVGRNNEHAEFTMAYEDNWCCEHAMEQLALNCDALAGDYDRTALVKQVAAIRQYMHQSKNEIVRLKDEIQALRKELKKNRLLDKANTKDDRGE